MTPFATASTADESERRDRRCFHAEKSATSHVDRDAPDIRVNVWLHKETAISPLISVVMACICVAIVIVLYCTDQRNPGSRDCDAIRLAAGTPLLDPMCGSGTLLIEAACWRPTAHRACTVAVGALAAGAA